MYIDEIEINFIKLSQTHLRKIHENLKRKHFLYEGSDSLSPFSSISRVTLISAGVENSSTYVVFI